MSLKITAPKCCAFASVMVVILLLLAGLPATAIPMFAKRHGYDCSTCHSYQPRLNDFGARFRDSGYRLRLEEVGAKESKTSRAPMSVRTVIGYNSVELRNSDSYDYSRSEGQISNITLASGGPVGRSAGYYFSYIPDTTGSESPSQQDATLREACLVFPGSGRFRHSVRVGRFHPSYRAFDADEQLAYATPLVYTHSLPGNRAYEPTQQGLEFTGCAGEGYSYALGWVSGADNNDLRFRQINPNKDHSPSDFYVRAAKVFGEGDGLSSGQRIGFSYYRGKFTVQDIFYGDLARGATQHYGLDANINRGKWNFGVQTHHSRHKDVMTGPFPPVDEVTSGGFAQLSYASSPKLVGFARCEIARTNMFIDSRYDSWLVGARYYLKGNTAVHLEYVKGLYRFDPFEDSSAGHISYRFLTLDLDFAF